MARKREVRFEPAVAKPGSMRSAVSPADDPADERTIADVEYRGADFAEAHVHGASFERCLFDSVRFPSTLRQATIAESALRVCDLANVQADDSSMFETVIEHGRITGLSWTTGVLRDVAVESTRADLASFAESRLRSVVFRDCDLRQADFQRAEFRNVRFERCNLTAARFSDARLHQNLRFEDCDLTAVSGLTALRGATIQGGDLESLATALARELGIVVESGPEPGARSGSTVGGYRSDEPLSADEVDRQPRSRFGV